MGDIAQGQQVSKRLPAKQLIPYVLLVVGAVAMAVSFFLPFASAKGDYAEYLKQYGDRVYTAEAGLHNKDVVGLSLLTFLRIYIAGLQSGKLLGGILDAGPLPSGGFRVRASIPVGDAPSGFGTSRGEGESYERR